MSAPSTAAAPARLFLHFKGWATIRLPTDPDPADEKRGVSGYTFALADEPDLDRQIRLQPQREPESLRDGAPWEWGVNVDRSWVIEPDGTSRDVALVGSPVDWLGGPKLENRNWLFTLPGWEPIVPFEVSVEVDGGVIQRFAPLTKDNRPVYQVSLADLTAQAATGVNTETETFGVATGIWDGVTLMRQRLAVLAGLLAAAKTDAKRTIYRARLREVEATLANPRDRRMAARFAVERFGFPIKGDGAKVPATGPAAGLDPDAPWSISFFLTGFDPDTLALFIQGCLVVPYAAAT